MKVAITGATGCVGQNLLEKMLAEGWEVIVLHRKSSDLTKLKDYNVKFAEMEFLDIDSIRRVIPENLDGLFHVAANSSHWSKHSKEQWDENVYGTRNLLKVAQEKKVKRFIHTSTGAVLTADKMKFVKSFYILSKKQSELEVLEAAKNGLDAVILRLPIVLGKYDYGNYVSIFLHMKKNPITLSFPGVLIFAGGEDIAMGHIQAFYKGVKGKIYHLGGEMASWYDVFKKIAKLLGVSPGPIKTPVWACYIFSYILVTISFFTNKKPLVSPQIVYLINGTPEREDVRAFLENAEEAKSIGYNPASIDHALGEVYHWLKETKRI